MAHGEPRTGDAAAPVRAGGAEWLDIRVAEAKQLFNMMDPAPFRERDIDPNAETYIVEWGQEAPADRPLGLVVHLAGERATRDVADMLGNAFHEYFRRRAQAARQRLRRLFRNGRTSLAIGLAFLAAAILLAEFLSARIGEGRYASIIEESLVIGGWVALWRPLEIFLYDWWPIRGEARLFDRLGEMRLRVVGADGTSVSAGDR